MAEILLEVCVDDPEGLAEAVAGGADRIELCAALGIGGLTPTFGLMQVAARCGHPCYPMIRPRSGDFVFTAAEVDVMRADIRATRAAGLTGVVLGASRPDGTLDEETLSILIAEALHVLRSEMVVGFRFPRVRHHLGDAPGDTASITSRRRSTQPTKTSWRSSRS